LCFPDPPPTPVTAVLDRAGYPWRAIATPESADIDEPEDGWSGAVICSGDDPAGAFLVWRTGRGLRPELVEHGPLVLNLETYQAAVSGRVLDLTYMEYELLRFLSARPGKVFTRETLLSRVWGYEYYGGARTVDVHVRRVRAKLGEEHAHLIQTVRSVGYRFGQTTWTP
jgi:DNA-binding response OmpR family regulator